MNKVITINLGGTAYQLEEGGYDTLRKYLEAATASLQANPDRDEILSDIERAIGEKFRALLNNHKTVIVTKEVDVVLAEMGPIEAGPDVKGTSSSAGAAADAGKTPDQEAGTPGGTPRRLYRINEGAMIAGVCNGLAAYFGIDPTLVRLAFAFLGIFWGTGVLVYIIMAVVVPEARSPQEKAAASGFPATAQEFIRRAKEGYYDAMKNFQNPKTRGEWHHWSRNWRAGWEEGQPVNRRVHCALPLLSLLEGTVTIAGVCALISLLATGALFGLALPSNVPVWVAALLLFILYGILAGPLKAARKFCYWDSGKPGGGRPFVFFLDAIIWFAVVAALLWLAVHYFPVLHDAVQSIPTVVHQAGDDINTWWHDKHA
jgi:phage shock protein PspC (stress-responsive transcriptional regulator)